MKPRKSKFESNDQMYSAVFKVFLFLGLGTFIHDPILHGIIAWLNGWAIDDYQTGLMIGYTSVIAPVNASWQSYWVFFMFPAVAIFILVAIATFIKPEKSVMVGGIILMSLNLPSLNPAITGSDAYNAVDILVKSGFSESLATALHYLLFFAVVSVWALYLYVTIENSEPDARRRIENIYH